MLWSIVFLNTLVYDSILPYGPHFPVLYGLAVHFKIYPIYFVLAMLLYLDDSYDAGGGADRGLRHVCVGMRRQSLPPNDSEIFAIIIHLQT